MLTDDSQTIQESFIEGNEDFIKRNAKLALEEVPLPKRRDKFIEEDIAIKVNVAKHLGLDEFDKDYYRKKIEMKKREMIEGKNPLLSTRQIQNEGGPSMAKPDFIDIDGDGNKTESMKTAAKQAKERDGMAHGGEPLPNKGLEELHKEEPDVVAKMLREQKQEGGDMDMQMSMLMDKPEPEKEMLPDEEMEDNYIDFILDEALSEEEEDMLMSKLQQDEQLSMLFDKVIEVASEFAGSGPVEGPGSGVSDSIPARLSDGEFVFTAKAAKEIGADELMRMMKDAEANADARQEMRHGGDVEEEMVTLEPDQEPVTQEIRVVKETVDSPSRMIEDEDEISKSIKSSMMLDPMQRHVRS